MDNHFRTPPPPPPLQGQVPLPPKVEEVINRICAEKHHDPPDHLARKKLAQVGEEAALDVVRRIYNTPNPIRTLSGYITHLVNQSDCGGAGASCSQVAKVSCATTTAAPEGSIPYYFSPLKRPLPSSPSASPISPQNGESSGYQKLDLHVGSPSSSNLPMAKASKVSRQLQFSGEPECNEEKITPEVFSYQRTILTSKLEYRKLFLIYSYIGRRKFEDVVSDDDADEILEMKDLPMGNFESRIWDAYGKRYVPADRRQSTEWDTGKTHLYYCYVYADGSCSFKGPCLDTTSTHLQRTLGDDNILIVEFAEDGRSCIDRILKEGILVGLRCYKFFVIKDESKGTKKQKEMEKDKTSLSPAVRCYFVNYDSIAARGNSESYSLCPSNLNKARCHFMHVHMVSSLAKYMARFSLILSKTIKLPVDLSSIVIERIEDIPCRDGNGDEIRDEDGEVLVLTDGTGFISEDLALKCPQNFCSAKFLKDNDFEDVLRQERRVEDWNRKPPLLMQCRLFSRGLAVKGTLLVNRKLDAGTIQIRSSMVKVERDIRCPVTPTFDSLEIVAISHKPRRCQLSKNLIALLSYGGVPRNFFLDMLRNVLEETQALFTNLHAALKVSIRNGDMDDGWTTARMILAGVPLSEPHLQDRLAKLANFERRSLKKGKLPISESFYVMGTADPTGLLKANEVCVILENGQISGKVLVYRNPGLHFGDIHVLEAVYVKELEDVIGNAKFGIFFSTKGQRSVANEIANGDFDGDMYWVSRNPQLLKYFRASEPWTRVYSSPPAENKKPSDFSAEALEYELFRLFLEKQKPSFNMAVAADSWLAFMDCLLVLRDENAGDTDGLRQKILKLVDIYYDALDAPKSGKKVNVPNDLIAKSYPHYMGKGNSYHSTSILGDIFDQTEQFQSERRSIGEIWKLPCFNSRIPEEYLSMWRARYDDYRYEMRDALEQNPAADDLKNKAADRVIKKYKELLYEAAELQESKKKMEEINNEALAIYHVSYDHAIGRGCISKCSFAWRVAGSALCNLHATNTSTNEYPTLVVPSILRNALF
ncbi:probable RNA-dependent RNA polymerase 5 isoform X1 [Coffea arabica]|uniref:RNA-dependent RNA polymerase n=1 Tax=Coffea arabica TaxID=13443 RepID=A0ABM4UUV0_COFAR